MSQMVVKIAPLVGSRRSRRIIFCVICATFFAVVGCAHQPGMADSYDAPGFWFGLLHGFIVVFSFIGSLFTNVRIYAFPNSGGWYDFGYLIGIALFFGGAGASA
jgi:hypothetical protein